MKGCVRLKNKIFSFALALFLFFGLALNSALAPKAVAGNVVGVTPWKDSEKGLEYIFISHSKPSTCAVDYAYMLQSKKVKERALHLRFDLSQKNNSPIVSEKGQIGLILTFHDKSSYILNDVLLLYYLLALSLLQKHYDSIFSFCFLFYMLYLLLNSYHNVFRKNDIIL